MRKVLSLLLAFLFVATFSCKQEELTEAPVTPADKEVDFRGGMVTAPGQIGLLTVDDGDTRCTMVDNSNYLQMAEAAIASGQPVSNTSTAAQGAAGANINVAYLGFTPPAQAAFQAAVDTWSGTLDSDVDINVIALFTPLGPGVLGAAGTTLIVRDFPGAERETWYGMALADKLAGEDLIPGEFDIVCFFSSAFPNWYFGTDGNTPAGDFDFYTVVLHELCHGLGFFGSMTVDANGIGSWGFGTEFPAIYDRFAITRPGRQLLKENKFPNFSAELGDALTGDQILFSGPNTISTTKGDRAVLFTFPQWLQGSSYSHLDEFTYLPGSGNELMTPFIGRGQFVAGPDPIVLSIFDDIGWNGKVRRKVQ